MTTLMKHQQYNQDIQTLKAMASIAVNSQKYGPDYNEATIMNIFFTAKSLGVDPMVALNGGFYIVKGKINMSAHFMVALARRKGHSIKVLEVSDKKCVIIGQRKDNQDSLKYEYTWQDAERAGLTNKQTWRDNPKQMLYAACVRTVFRMLFSDLGIAYDADEMNVDIPAQSQNEDDGMGIEIAPVSIPDLCANQEIKDNSIGSLRQCLEEDGIDSSYLEDYLRDLSKKKDQSVDQIIKSALMEQLLPKFKAAYIKELSKKSTPVEVVL